MFNIVLLAANHEDNNTNKKERLQKHLQKQMQKEKKYSKEQQFYGQDRYDFKGAEVNPDSVKDTPTLEVDDLDMDSVYD